MIAGIFFFFQFCDIKKLTKKNFPKNSKFNQTHTFFQKLPNIFCHKKKVMDCYLGPSHNLIANGK
jgi:hypothetical protein